MEELGESSIAPNCSLSMTGAPTPTCCRFEILKKKRLLQLNTNVRLFPRIAISKGQISFRPT